MDIDPPPAPFRGFPPAAFEWFTELAADNSRAWFQAHREIYDRAVRGPLEAMLDALSAELGGDVKVFRQHRDVRFSPDKSPYKTETYGIISRLPASLSGLYVQLSAEGLFSGTGLYAPAPDQLARYRAAVDDGTAGPQLEAAAAAAQAAGVEIFGETLKTAPRGYPRDHPRGRWLRHRMLITGRRLAPGRRGITGPAALEHARTTWAACAPLNAWLVAHVGPAQASPDRPRRGAGRSGRA